MRCCIVTMGLLDTFCIDLVDPVDACRLGWAVGETNCDGCCVVLASRVHLCMEKQWACCASAEQ